MWMGLNILNLKGQLLLSGHLMTQCLERLKSISGKEPGSILEKESGKMTDLINEKITVKDIHASLSDQAIFGRIYVKEYTYNDKRIDGIIIDTKKRSISGYEIKVSRSDFFSDKKWESYSEFCSTLSIVCPHGLIKKDEVLNPFGLIWISRSKYGNSLIKEYVKRPKNIQRGGLSWLYSYISVIEKEFPRLMWELRHKDD
jgi:hypothetical protein